MAGNSDSGNPHGMRYVDEPEKRAEFLRVFEKNNCQTIRTCSEVGISHWKYKDWCKQFPDFNEAVKTAKAKLNERVEDSLVGQALEPGGPPVSKIFWLKNNWQEKYGERQVLEVQPSQLWFEQKKELEKPELKQLEGKKDGTS